MEGIKLKIEQLFEKSLWNSKAIIILAVISGMLGAFVLILMGTYEIFMVISDTPNAFVNKEQYEEFNKEAITHIVNAIDIYLIAVVLMIFGYGLYEIFISRIDVAEASKDAKTQNILIIHSLDVLKNKLIKVIITVLIVTYFNYAISVKYADVVQLLYLSAGILLIAIAVFLINRPHRSSEE